MFQQIQRLISPITQRLVSPKIPNNPCQKNRKMEKAPNIQHTTISKEKVTDVVTNIHSCQRHNFGKWHQHPNRPISTRTFLRSDTSTRTAPVQLRYRRFQKPASYSDSIRFRVEILQSYHLHARSSKGSIFPTLERYIS